MRTCGHIAVVNSRALALAGIASETPDPPGGVILHDASGEPNGILQETAMELVGRLIPEPSDEEMAAALGSGHAAPARPRHHQRDRPQPDAEPG